jgi:hypothetical protein
VSFSVNKTLNCDKTKTSIHDVKMIELTINKITKIKNNSKNCYLMSDKAYKNQMKIK